MARSSLDLLHLFEELTNKAVDVRFINSPEFNTDALNGKLAITILAAVAEFAREMIEQRLAEGIV